MNYDRIYEYRFKNINKNKKLDTWQVIAHFISKQLGCPESIIDPAAGECEFINAFPAKDKWAIDSNTDLIEKYAGKNVHVKSGDCLTVELPPNFFQAVFISNFLEHLHSQNEIQQLLVNMLHAMKDGGKIAVIGPNYKYCPRQYFDFADHNIILTHLSLEEHLYGAGFKINKVIPRFLPLTFRSNLPINKYIVEMYLSLPFLWKLFGKQFFIIAEK